MDIRERLKKVRASLGYSQKKMAGSAGVAIRTWQIYEEGGSTPGGNVLESLARLGFDTNWILTGEGDMRRGERREEERAPIAPVVKGPTPEYGRRASDFDLNKGMVMLGKIYGSNNQVMIRAIVANLMAFSEAIDADRRADELEKANQRLEAKVETLEGRLEKLEKLLAEPRGKAAEGGNGA